MEEDDVEECSNEALVDFLQSLMGEDVDQETLEEFKRTDLFDEVRREIQSGVIQFPSSSRRSSLAEPGVEINFDNQFLNIESEDQLHNQDLATSSKYANEIPTATDSALSIKSSDTTDSGMSSKQKQKLKTGSSKANQDKSNWNKDIEQITKDHHDHGKGTGQHRKPSSTVDTKLECQLQLWDLALMSNIFPNGVPVHVLLTYKLIEEIRNFESLVRSAEACKKFNKQYVKPKMNASNAKGDNQNQKNIKSESKSLKYEEKVSSKKIRSQEDVGKARTPPPKPSPKKLFSESVGSVHRLYNQMLKIPTAVSKSETATCNPNVMGISSNSIIVVEDSSISIKENITELASCVNDEHVSPSEKIEIMEPAQITRSNKKAIDSENFDESANKSPLNALNECNSNLDTSMVDTETEIVELPASSQLKLNENDSIVSNTIDEDEKGNSDFHMEEQANNHLEVKTVDDNDNTNSVIIETRNDEEVQDASPECSPVLEHEPPSPEKPDSRSASPEKMVYKRKIIIESSSDDDLKRADTADDPDTTPERKKSSDEDHIKASLPFERKREQIDSRSKKFDKFENERQRKLGEKKRSSKPKDSYGLEEVLKEKPLSGSFRIPKKTMGTSKKSKPTLIPTPLTCSEVPKENLQFERFRKGSEKKEYKDFNKGRDVNRDRLGFNKQEGDQLKNMHWDRKDQTDREIALAPEESKLELEDPPSPSHSPIMESDIELQPEPQQCNDNEDSAADSDAVASSLESKSESEHNWYANELNTNTVENVEIDKKDNEDMSDEEGNNNEKENPEIPRECVPTCNLSKAVMYFVDSGEKLELPAIDNVESSYNSSVMKLAWWLSNVNLQNPQYGGYDSESECSDGANGKFLDGLDFTEDDDQELYHSLHNSCYQENPGPVDEFCGRSLLSATYRSGPNDKFDTIFQIRGLSTTYDRENFQARCTICNSLVVGKAQLADHIISKQHSSKMTALGGINEDDLAPDRKLAKDKPGKTEVKEVEKRESNHSKGQEGTKSNKVGDVKKKDDKKDVTTERVSRDRLGASELKDKDRVHSSRSDRKRSRSPHARRSRSPKHGMSSSNKHKSKSPSRSRRHHRSRTPSRHKSKSPTRSRRSRSPTKRIERIPRSPTRLKEGKERQRSTSAEKVEKFLAQTNKRPRSPASKYHRKRHRRSRSKSPSSGHVLHRQDTRQFNEKLSLISEGKWTPEMEQRWSLMEAEQAIFMEEHGEKQRKLLKDAPESHPDYAEEWKIFWERKFQEVEDEGKDPDSYDYIPEWKIYWTKRLKALLDEEYSNGLKEIKVKHGVDLDSLRKLHKNPTDSPNIIPALPSPVVQYTPLAPSVTPIPSSHPVIVQNMPSNVLGEDYMTRPMSISDAGDSHSAKESVTGSSVNGQSKEMLPVVTTGDIMSTWEKLTSGGVSSYIPRPPNNTIASQHSSKTSLLVTSTKVVETASVDSGSIASVEFDGFGLTEVLRHMSSNLEDQLSFFADKVKEYFKKAEDLDLKKKNKSLKLLDDEDFVIMLIQVRDRLNAMNKPNILPTPVRRDLNYAIYSLDSIFETPQCQKVRSKLTILSMPANTVPEEESEVVEIPKPSEIKQNVKSVSAPVQIEKKKVVSSKQKEKIASLLAEFLVTMGRENLSDGEMRELVAKFVPSNNFKSINFNNKVREDVNILRLTTTTSKSISEVTTNIIETTTAIAAAAPLTDQVHDMGPLGCREKVLQHDNNYHSSSESASGRRSPFSRRNFTGNPGANPFPDKDTKHHKRSRSQYITCEQKHTMSTINEKLPGTSVNDVTSSQMISPTDGPTIEIPPKLSKLPPGIRCIIMKEQNAKALSTKEKNRSPSKSSGHRYKRSWRRKEKKYRHSTSCDSSSESDYSYKNRKRPERKRRRNENKSRYRNRSPSPAVISISSESQHSYIERTNVYKVAPNRVEPRYGGNGNYAETETSKGKKIDCTKYPVTTNKSFSSSKVKTFQRNPEHSVRITWPKTVECDALSEVSSSGLSVKYVAVNSVSGGNSSNTGTRDDSRVISVSKNFWCEKPTDDIDKTLSSVSSIEFGTVSSHQKDHPPVQKRKLRGSFDKQEQEREPGEIPSSSSEY